jgi:hypothetical protein
MNMMIMTKSLRQGYIKFILPAAVLLAVCSCKKSDTAQTAVADPIITSFTPLQGLPGDTVVISGSNFGSTISGCSVSFNGTSAVVASVSGNQIKSVVPAGVTTGKISVNINGLVVVSTDDFLRAAYISTLAGNGTPAYNDGIGTNASFQFLTDLVLDTLGNVYVADASNYRIRKITPQGVVTTIAGSGVSGAADGTGIAANFGTMLGIAIDKTNTFLYVADLGNHNIRKVSLTGTVTTLAGGGWYGFIDGPANVAKFHLPMGVAVDGANNVYVADAGNNSIRLISSAGVVSTVAGDGTAGFVNGTGSAARFNNPIKIKIKSTGELVVLDGGNHSVRIINAGGVVSTLSGTGIAGYANGASGTAQFNAPAGLCLDHFDNIYVGDQLNQRIRKISTSGVVSTVAGTGVSGYLDGSSLVAKFQNPCGLDINSSGVIYVADNQNHRIRSITN